VREVGEVCSRQLYRIVVWINYPYRVVYIRFIGTHRQYDGIDAQTV
jgi:mRNA interferase HigB